MKFLELSEEGEKILAYVLDAALKSGGLSMHHQVVKLLSYVKEEPSSSKDVKPE